MNIPYYEDVALLLLSELAIVRNIRIVPLSEIAAKHGISPLFLKKIARILRNTGFVFSKEGKNGGYGLAVDPSRTSLWDVYQAVDQSRGSEIKNSTFLYSTCPVNTMCLPQIIRTSIRSTIQESMESITLKSLIHKMSV